MASLEPLQTVQGCFYQGKVMRMCAGWFGEIGKDLSKVIKILAREVASGDYGMTIPLMIWAV